jgi:integrase/recombinase XerD
MQKKAWTWTVSGPLDPYATGYWQALGRQGYALETAKAHMQLMAHVSRWLAQRGLEPTAFGGPRVEQFLADRRSSGQVRRLTSRGLIPLLGYLRERGVVPQPTAPAPEGPVGRLCEDFAGFLATERGLAPATIRGYRRVAELFLTACAPDPTTDGCGLARLSVREINGFLLAECARRSVGSANNMVTGLRALLRFLFLQGSTPAPLADATPRTASWRDGGRSRAVEPGHVARLLASCDRRTAAGRRDHALLKVLSRLGLRCGEAAALGIDDINWRAGELLVTGKGNRRDRLPLPVDVGTVLADYCQRGRPRGGCRALFLQVRAPYAALSPSAVSHVVIRACLRAGVPPAGSHRLRHSAASEMRRAGVPLYEIGQVLRHRHGVTTAVYAKDDIGALTSIARAWPGGAA